MSFFWFIFLMILVCRDPDRTTQLCDLVHPPFPDEQVFLEIFRPDSQFFNQGAVENLKSRCD